MARRRDQKRANALLAAAAVIHPENRQETPRYDTWQDEAWAMFNNLGEFRQGVTWLGNIISRARLVAAYAPEHQGDEPQIIDDVNDPAVQLVEAIGDGISGQSELLRSAAVHLTVVGEGWFVGDRSNEDLSWKFYSADELRVRTQEGGRKIYQVQTHTGEWDALGSESLPVRIWHPHERYHWHADSSTRAALPIMRRLELLNRHVDAIVQSRLASAGVYWVPSEIVFPANPAYPDATDPFIAELMDLAITAIKTPGSAAAAVPFIARAPAEFIKEIRHDTFFDDFQKELQSNREFEIRRLSTAIDIPPEVLLGMSAMNHWGAWQVEESALKTTVTALLELIVGGLTCGYLYPALSVVTDQDVQNALAQGLRLPQENVDEVPLDAQGRKRIIWYDVSELTVRPDRSQDAISLYDRFVASPDAALRESGLADADRPSDDDLKFMLGVALSKDPATIEIAMELLGIKTTATVVKPPSTDTSAPAPPSNGNGNTPQTENRPPPGAPSQPRPQPAQTPPAPGG